MVIISRVEVVRTSVPAASASQSTITYRITIVQPKSTLEVFVALSSMEEHTGVPDIPEGAQGGEETQPVQPAFCCISECHYDASNDECYLRYHKLIRRLLNEGDQGPDKPAVLRLWRVRLAVNAAFAASRNLTRGFNTIV